MDCCIILRGNRNHSEIINEISSHTSQSRVWRHCCLRGIGHQQWRIRRWDPTNAELSEVFEGDDPRPNRKHRRQTLMPAVFVRKGPPVADLFVKFCSRLGGPWRAKMCISKFRWRIHCSRLVGKLKMYAHFAMRLKNREKKSWGRGMSKCIEVRKPHCFWNKT